MRAPLTALLCGLAALAAANAAMGYALEQYDGRAWLAYVGLTVVFEAWAIGRWAGLGWPKAVAVSMAANFVTACCCSSLCGVGLHQSFVGSRLNPNPFLNMVVMFTVFGALSGWIESAVWLFFREKRDDNSTALRSIGAHLAWVPFGVAIMLVPSRPYPKLEGYVCYARRSYVIGTASRLNAKVRETGRVPAYRDATAFFAAMRPLMSDPPDDAWTVAYRPDFGRLATGQTRGALLWEWNPKANGVRLDDPKRPESVWLLRMVSPDRPRPGLVLNGDGVRYVSDVLGAPAR